MIATRSACYILTTALLVSTAAADPLQLSIPAGKPRVTIDSVKGKMTVDMRKKYGVSGSVTAAAVAAIDLPAKHAYDVTVEGADRVVVQVGDKFVVSQAQSARGPVTVALDELPAGHADILIGSFQYDEFDASIVVEDRARRPGDADLDRMAIDLILGDLHKVDFTSTPPKLDAVEVPELNAITRRARDAMTQWFTDVDHYKGAEIALGSPMNRKVCITQEHRLGDATLAAAESTCGGLSGVHFPTEWSELASSVATRLLYFDALVRRLPDEAAQTKAKQRFAAHMGWEPLSFRPSKLELSFVMKPVPMTEWPPAVIKVALEYAAGDAATTDALRAALKMAQPWGCAWTAGALVRNATGRGFGAPHYDDKLTVRPDIAGSGGMIACTEAKKVKSDGASLAIVKKTDKDALGVELVSGQNWQTNTDDFGRPTSMTRIVRIYERVKRTDVTPGSLPE